MYAELALTDGDGNAPLKSAQAKTKAKAKAKVEVEAKVEIKNQSCDRKAPLGLWLAPREEKRSKTGTRNPPSSTTFLSPLLVRERICSSSTKAADSPIASFNQKTNLNHNAQSAFLFLATPARTKMDVSISAPDRMTP
jgi:hypothetical protein